jgi:hypothetical protein
MYRPIAQFAPKINTAYSTDPMFYCSTDYITSQMLHGTQGRTFGHGNRACAEWMSERCSKNWDQVCEAASLNKDASLPDMTVAITGEMNMGLSQGEILIRDAAYKKYRVSSNCNTKCEPFDPTVPNSPMICYQTSDSCGYGPSRADACKDKNVCSDGSGVCSSKYSLTRSQIQQLNRDIIMNKLIDKAEIAPILLANIYNSLLVEGRLLELKGTRLGAFYEVNGMPLTNKTPTMAQRAMQYSISYS